MMGVLNLKGSGIKALTLVVVHRQYLFHLGTWRIKTKAIYYVLNKEHSTIKFTAEWSKIQINFLDVTVYLENGKIKTDLYVKPTDTH